MGGLSCQPKRPDKEVQIMEKQYRYLHWGSNTHSSDYTVNYIISLQETFKENKRVKFLGGYWSPRAKELYSLLDEEDKIEVDDRMEPLLADSKDVIAELTCPKCDHKMVEKDGKYGLFYSCSQFPSCWGSLPHPDNPSPKFEKKKEPISKEDMVVTRYHSYSIKRNGKPVKSRTPTEHSVYFEDDEQGYTIKTHGRKQHLYIGDKCSFEYKENWKGELVIHKRTLFAFDKSGNPIKGRFRNCR